MSYEAGMRAHEEAALREKDAAARATCEQSGRAHSALSDLHRYEAAKMNSVRVTLKMAFDD